MRPKGLRSRIFLDGGDPVETRVAIGLLGFLDGQTTNPTLISKNPKAKARLERGEEGLAEEEALGFYREVVREISNLIPQGSVSVEVYADGLTSAGKMFAQGREMFGWIPNAHVKFPTTPAGLEAASQSVREGMRINMTLCFSEDQAAAVYAATRGAKKGDVLVSPFVGRLDDRGENGMDLIANLMRLYARGDGHVEVLTASVRNLDHLLYAIQLRSDVVTAPFRVLEEWGKKNLMLPDSSYSYGGKGKTAILPKNLDLDADWRSFDIRHELTDKGVEQFASDWNTLIRQ